MRKIFIFSTALFFTLLPFHYAKAQIYKGTINKVKIYNNEANIEKSVSFPIKGGVNEIKLVMPRTWQEQSIQFLEKGDFIIQEFTPLTQENENAATMQSSLSAKDDALLKTLKDSLLKLVDSQAEDNALLAIYNRQKTSIENMKVMTQSSQMDSVAKIRDGLSFYETKMMSLTRKIRSISKTISERQLEISSLNKKIQKLQEGVEPLEKYQKYEVLTIYSNKDIANAHLTYSYNVEGVAWSPYYDVQFSKKSNDVSFVLKAKLRQSSGEDWKNVPLCFSTETVNNSGELQELNPYYLYYQKPMAFSRSNRVMLMDKSANKQEESEQESPEEDNEYAVDAIATTVAGASNGTGYSQYTQSSETLLGKEYTTGLNHSVLSGDKDKTIALESQDTKASYKYYTVPKLEKRAYIVAQIADWERMQLVSAPTKIYIDGDYTCQGELNTANTKDTLSLSVGEDKRVSIERKVTKSKPEKSSLLSSSIETEVSVTLTVKNNNQKAITINVADQVPVSQSKDIKVTTKDLHGASYDEKTGRLSWEVALKASESAQITFSYVVKCPKNSNIILN